MQILSQIKDILEKIYLLDTNRGLYVTLYMCKTI